MLQQSSESNSHNKFKFPLTFFCILGIILLFISAVKFWHTGTLRIGNYYINGWTPFNDVESYFYFGKYDRQIAYDNLINIDNQEKVEEMGIYTPTPPNNPITNRNDSSPTSLEFEFEIAKGWKYSNRAGYQTISIGNPKCTCGGYECHHLGFYNCKEEEVDNYSEINVDTTAFCDRFSGFFQHNNNSADCADFSFEDFIASKDNLLVTSNLNTLESEGCGPYSVQGKPFISMVGVYDAIERDTGDSCDYPRNKEYYLYFPKNKTQNLLIIDVRNYKEHAEDVNKMLSTLKINPIE